MTDPAGAERRRYKRRFLQFAVRYRFNAEGVITDWKESEAGNVSAGGLFMTFGEDLRVGRVIDVEFTVPGRDKPIRAKGAIVWTKVVVPDTMVECGFEFSEIRPEDRAFLVDFTDAGDTATPSGPR